MITDANIHETLKQKQTYWLTRFVILRMLGAIYAVAFLVIINQILPLIGSDGLLPVNIYLKRISEAIGPASGFMKLPSIFWFTHSDHALIIFAWIGFLLACIVVAGFANMPILAMLWFLYLSFVHIGQEWYGFGWEIQLTETGFLAIFLCPFIDMRPFPKHAPPFTIIVLFRWLAFRIMFGAGLIKLRGDELWRNRTALYYHFETQPMPGPLSRWFHFLSPAILRAGVWFNWVVELIAPLFVFWPRIARHISGALIILFQIVLILSGNLSFLNCLTIVPALACFDDGFWSKLLPKKIVQTAKTAAETSEPSKPLLTTAWAVTILVALLSIQPIVNMLSREQVMNGSFEPFELVNTYGAFGSVGKERMNVIFEGTADEDSSDNANWQPYIYKGLPVDLKNRPPQIAPYQLHFDWQMWFAAMSSPQDYPWTFHLVWKLLHNDAAAVNLFASNPFQNKPPRYIRAVLYRYQFAEPNDNEHSYWQRNRLAIWIPAISEKDQRLLAILKDEGWLQ